MLNYLKAELYKAGRRRTLLPAALLLGGLEGVFLLINGPAGMDWRSEGWLKLLLNLLISGVFLLTVPAGVVFSEQHKHATLKNEVCFGIPRGRVYLGKLLASAVLAALFCAGMILLWFGLGGVLGSIQPGGDPARVAAELGLGLLTALPIWLGALGLFHALQFTVRSTPLVYTLYLGYFFVVEPLLGMLEPFRRGLLFGPLGPLGGLSAHLGPELLVRAWQVGPAWLGVTTAIGLALFYRRDIQ